MAHEMTGVTPRVFVVDSSGVATVTEPYNPDEGVILFDAAYARARQAAERLPAIEAGRVNPRPSPSLGDILYVVMPYLEVAEFVALLDKGMAEFLSLNQPAAVLENKRSQFLNLLIQFFQQFPPETVKKILSDPYSIAMAVEYVSLFPRAVEEVTRRRYGIAYKDLVQLTEEKAGYSAQMQEMLKRETSVAGVRAGAFSMPGGDFPLIAILKEKGIIPASSPAEPFRVLKIGAAIYPRPRRLDSRVSRDFYFSPDTLLLAEALPDNGEVEAIDFDAKVLAPFNREKMTLFLYPKLLASCGSAGIKAIDRLSRLGPYRDFRRIHPDLEDARLIEVGAKVAGRISVRQMDAATESYGPQKRDLVVVSLMEHLLDVLDEGNHFLLIHLIKALDQVKVGGHIVFTRKQNHPSLGVLPEHVLKEFGFSLIGKIGFSFGVPADTYIYRRDQETEFFKTLSRTVEEGQAKVRGEKGGEGGQGSRPSSGEAGQVGAASSPRTSIDDPSTPKGNTLPKALADFQESDFPEPLFQIVGAEQNPSSLDFRIVGAAPEEAATGALEEGVRHVGGGDVQNNFSGLRVLGAQTLRPAIGRSSAMSLAFRVVR